MHSFSVWIVVKMQYHADKHCEIVLMQDVLDQAVAAANSTGQIVSRLGKMKNSTSQTRQMSRLVRLKQGLLAQLPSDLFWKMLFWTLPCTFSTKISLYQSMWMTWVASHFLRRSSWQALSPTIKLICKHFNGIWLSSFAAVFRQSCFFDRTRATPKALTFR